MTLDFVHNVELDGVLTPEGRFLLYIRTFIGVIQRVELLEGEGIVSLRDRLRLLGLISEEQVQDFSSPELQGSKWKGNKVGPISIDSTRGLPSIPIDPYSLGSVPFPTPPLETIFSFYRPKS